MRPTVRQLEYLVAVADARHFGRAARASAVTQPALSAQIRQLEELLGVRLLERGRRGAIPTAAGERVVERARRALAAIDDVVDAARNARAPLAGRLHLGVIPTVAPFYLPRWLPKVRRAYPELRLFLHEDQTARLIEQLEGGKLDLLLLALPVGGADLESEALFDEPFLLAVPADHVLARRGRRRASESELRDEPVLLLEDGHCLRDQALAVCRHAGARERDELRAASLHTLVQMVANGLGVTLLPAASVDALVPSREVEVRPFRAPAPSRRLGLVWRRASPRADEYRLLGGLFRRHAPDFERAVRSRRGG